MALELPALLCKILIAENVIDPTDEVCIVVKEGSRTKGSGMKVSMHFIFQLLLTPKQYNAVWAIVCHTICGIKVRTVHCPTLYIRV
jgi:hypothetical protein